MRKSLRIMMHALAGFMLLVAVATPVFWVRSRTRDEIVGVRWNSVYCYMGSWNSKAGISLERAPAGPLEWLGRSDPSVPGGLAAWSYTAIGWDWRAPPHWFEFLGVEVESDPVAKWVYIPDSYLLLFCLSVPTWWFWRVRKQRKKRQSGFEVEPLGLKDKG